jgi:hypothetical protein
MEHIATIRDGSEKSLGNWYWALSVIGAREYLFARQSGLKAFHNQWLEDNKQLSLFNP